MYYRRKPSDLGRDLSILPLALTFPVAELTPFTVSWQLLLQGLTSQRPLSQHVVTLVSINSNGGITIVDIKVLVRSKRSLSNASTSSASDLQMTKKRFWKIVSLYGERRQHPVT